MKRLRALVAALLAVSPAAAFAQSLDSGYGIVQGGFTGGTVTTPILFPDGTAGAPGMAFSSDSDGTGSGFYLTAANSIGMSTNGVVRVTLNTSTLTSTLQIVTPSGSVGTPGIVIGAGGSGLYESGGVIAVSTGGSSGLTFNGNNGGGVAMSAGRFLSLPLEASTIRWAAGTKVGSTTDGVVLVTDNAGTGFTSIRMASTTGVGIIRGSGAPESAVTAPVGSIYLRTDGGASTSFCVKESGTGNTGWVCK